MKFLLSILLLLNISFGLNSSLMDSTTHTTNEIRFYSDVTIDSSEVMTDNIRILGGELNVYGIVKSQITVIGGDVHIFPSAVVAGKIVAIGGDVVTDEGATITGKVVEASMDQGLIYRETFSDTTVKSKNESFGITDFSHRYRVGWVHPESDVFVLNRNEGLRLTPLNWNWDRGNESLIRLSFSLGYRFSSDEFLGRTTLESSLLANRSVTLYASGFKEARTDDDYRLPLQENTWANILGRQDFYDRWDETGFGLGFGLDFSNIKLKGEFVRATQSEIPVDNNVWSLFNNEQKPRINPIIQETDVEYLAGVFAFRTNSYTPLSTGFAILSKVEMVLKENEETLDDPTLRLSSMVIGNLKVTEGVVLRNRLMLGMASETLTLFRYFGVGGLGSVSAVDYKLQTGTHMGQLNSELIFKEEFTESWFLVKLFYDAGMAYSSTQLMDVGYIIDNSNNLLQSAGIGFGWEDGERLDLGFNFAKQLNANTPVETTVRINFNF